MYQSMKTHLSEILDQIRRDGLYKTERIIVSPQRNRITVLPDRPVLNFCANNYLGPAFFYRAFAKRGPFV